MPLVANAGLTSSDKGRPCHQNGGRSHTGVNIPWSYPQIVLTFPLAVDNAVDKSGESLTAGWWTGYFHWVETPKPAAMKPNPTTMFQFPKLSSGRSPSVT